VGAGGTVIGWLANILEAENIMKINNVLNREDKLYGDHCMDWNRFLHQPVGHVFGLQPGLFQHQQTAATGMKKAPRRLLSGELFFTS
jgi:hypothetical protein